MAGSGKVIQAVTDLQGGIAFKHSLRAVFLADGHGVIFLFQNLQVIGVGIGANTEKTVGLEHSRRTVIVSRVDHSCPANIGTVGALVAKVAPQVTGIDLVEFLSVNDSRDVHHTVLVHIVQGAVHIAGAKADVGQAAVNTALHHLVLGACGIADVVHIVVTDPQSGFGELEEVHAQLAQLLHRHILALNGEGCDSLPCQNVFYIRRFHIVSPFRKLNYVVMLPVVRTLAPSDEGAPRSGGGEISPSAPPGL